jgi:hypothetical protein
MAITMLPEALVGETHRGTYFCREWELRVTRRCLQEDLDQAADTEFGDLLGIEIIKTFVKDRAERTDDTRQVNGLRGGHPVWVLARGNDHRAGTIFDPEHHVVWLVAYHRHRSGQKDDFFPYCRSVDADGRLLPDALDYKALFDDRAHRFAFHVRIEAPLILRAARVEGKEQRAALGGRFGACVAVEVAEELEAITVAFNVDSVPFAYVPVILEAFKVGAWDPVAKMPSRPLEAGEYAFQWTGEHGRDD